VALTARGVRRKSELLELSAHLFAEKGWHSTTVTEIVTGLGVGKGVFYWKSTT